MFKENVTYNKLKIMENQCKPRGIYKIHQIYTYLIMINYLYKNKMYSLFK